MGALLNPWVLLGAVVALTGAVGGAYIKGRGDGKAVEIAAQNRAVVALREVERTVARAISEIEVKNVTVRQKAETIIREVPVYRDCKHTPDGMQAVNEALTGRPVGPSDSKLPGTNPGQ